MSYFVKHVQWRTINYTNYYNQIKLIFNRHPFSYIIGILRVMSRIVRALTRYNIIIIVSYWLPFMRQVDMLFQKYMFNQILTAVLSIYKTNIGNRCYIDMPYIIIINYLAMTWRPGSIWQCCKVYFKYRYRIHIFFYGLKYTMYRQVYYEYILNTILLL